MTTIQCDLSNDREVERMLTTQITSRVSSVVAQFAAHYFADNFQLLCDELLEDGGVAGVTMFDRRRVQQMLDATPNGERIFQIEGQDMVRVKYAGSRNCVSVWVSSIGLTHTETLYDPEDMLPERGYEIADAFHFDEIKATRKYGPKSGMWEFTGLYQAVLFQKIAISPSSPQRHAPSSPGSASPPRYAASGYAPSSPPRF